MAKQKERFITRTIKTTIAKTLFVDLSDGKTFVNDEFVPFECDQEMAFDFLRKRLNSVKFVVASVLSVEIQENLYRVREIDFLSIAEKVTKEESETDTEDTGL